MDSEWRWMKRTHARRSKNRLDKTEENERHKNTDCHPRHTCGKEVSRSRCKTESSVLEHHAIGKPEPDIRYQVHVIWVYLIVYQADKNQGSSDNKCPDLIFSFF